MRDKGQSPSSYPSEKYQKVRDHCRFTVGVGNVLVAFCTAYFCHKHSKNPSVSSEKYEEHLIAQNAEQLSNQKR